MRYEGMSHSHRYIWVYFFIRKIKCTYCLNNLLVGILSSSNRLRKCFTFPPFVSNSITTACQDRYGKNLSFLCFFVIYNIKYKIYSKLPTLNNLLSHCKSEAIEAIQIIDRLVSSSTQIYDKSIILKCPTQILRQYKYQNLPTKMLSLSLKTQI